MADLQESGLFIRYNGDMYFNGGTFQVKFPIVIIADGLIQISGVPRTSAEYPLILVSLNKNVVINGGGSDFIGIIYAPNGDIIMNGIDDDIYGSLIAQNITINGGSGKISYLDDLDRVLPSTKVHLVA